ncbi:MAG TPA: recombinase family protein [Symbiobacteriaceae bacterium]|jgi:site-specific DNA recombinase
MSNRHKAEIAAEPTRKAMKEKHLDRRKVEILDGAMPAIYARRSTDGQSENTSMEQQIERCRAYLISQGITAEPVLCIDDGESGATLDRPRMIDLRKDALAGRISIIVAYKVDRITRDLCDCVDLILKEWDHSGIAFQSVSESINTSTPLGRTILLMLAGFAENEREVIYQRMHDGKIKTAAMGKNAGHRTSYGYQRDANGYFYPDPTQAPVVVRIFDMYLSGMGTGQIPDLLNQEGTPAPEKSCWSRSSIHNILKNPMYIGTYEYAETRLEHNHPALITQAVWDKTVALRAIKAEPASRAAEPGEYTLTGLLRCTCGARMTGTRNTKSQIRYYRCLGRAQRTSAGCNCGSIPANTIETAVLEEVKKRLNPEAIRSHAEAVAAARQDLITSHESAVAQAESALAKINARRSRLDRDYDNEEISAKLYARKLDALEADELTIKTNLLRAQTALLKSKQSRVNNEALDQLAEDIQAIDGLTTRQITALLASSLACVTAHRPKQDGTGNHAIQIDIATKVDFLQSA